MIAIVDNDFAVLSVKRGYRFSRLWIPSQHLENLQADYEPGVACYLLSGGTKTKLQQRLDGCFRMVAW